MPRKQTYQISSDNKEIEYGKSRSQKKRESTALQKTGEQIVLLSSSELKEFPLSPALRSAIDEARSMPKKSEALRRQLQFIGRLMREDENIDALLKAFEELADRKASESFIAHRINERCEALIEASPEQRLRLCSEWGFSAELTKQALDFVIQIENERSNGRQPRAFRSLFHLLREA